MADPDPTSAGTAGAGRSHVDHGQVADDAEHVTSTPLLASEAQALVVALEQMGVESGLIRVDTAPALGPVEVGQVDQTALARPARRVALGAAIGAAIALVLGLIAMAIWSLDPAPVIIMTIIGGGLLGALWSLYARLSTNIEATDADTGYSTIHVATAELDDATNDRVRQAVNRAGQAFPTDWSGQADPAPPSDPAASQSSPVDPSADPLEPTGDLDQGNRRAGQR